MKIFICIALASMGCSTASELASSPGALGFDSGSASAWRAESTSGSGAVASWAIQADPKAVSAPNVVSLVATNHDSEDRFNLFWTDAVRFHDGRISVAVRADAGEIDQGGGPMWRVQDANNYYICRFNPLEANFRVYVVRDGARRQLATALVDTQAGHWYRIEVEHVGSQIECWFDGRKAFAVSDATIPAEGGIGLWTKADARTSFDDLLASPR